MSEVHMFGSRFYTFDDAIKHEELMQVLNAIKKDTENIVVVATGQGGPTYKTNYNQKEVHGELFKPIIEQLNKLLAGDHVSFELIGGAPWYAEYGEYDFHQPHTHAHSHITENDTSCFYYSGIICLSDFGETSFINSNYSSFVGSIMTIPSDYNRVILFPSNIHHYVAPHGLRNRVRAVFSFNCELKIDTFNANI